jgi:hypothetical protein
MFKTQETNFKNEIINSQGQSARDVDRQISQWLSAMPKVNPQPYSDAEAARQREAETIRFLVPQYLPVLFPSLSLEDQAKALALEEGALAQRKIMGWGRVGDAALETSLNYMRTIVDKKITTAAGGKSY